jgi:hypothetical protein
VPIQPDNSPRFLLAAESYRRDVHCDSDCCCFGRLAGCQPSSWHTDSQSKRATWPGCLFAQTATVASSPRAGGRCCALALCAETDSCWRRHGGGGCSGPWGQRARG